jgi:hypothetical protein
MASGLPQVVSDWDGYRDTVRHGETGFLVPTTWVEADSDLCDLAPLSEWHLDHFALGQSVVVEPKALHDALVTLVDDAALRARMGETGRKRAVSEYSWRTVVDRHEALWAELMQQAVHEKVERRSDPTRPYYVDTFRSFPSQFLSNTAVLKVSTRGEAVLSGEIAIPAHCERFGAFDFDLLEFTLGVLAVRGRCSVDELQTTLAERSASSPCILRHIMWLLKYGFAEVERPK